MTSPDQTAALPAAGDTAAATSSAGSGDLAAHAAALQTVLGQLSTVTLAQLVAFFEKYDGAPNFPALLAQAFPQIILPHAQAASTITAQWFNELAPRGNVSAKPTMFLPTQRLAKTVAWSLYAPTEKQPAADVQTTVAPDVTLSRLGGSTKRMVFDASRDTVLANAQAQGWKWARYASANACAFCRVMATKSNSKRLYNSSGVKIDPNSGNYILTVVGRGVDMSAQDQAIAAEGGDRRDNGQFIAAGRKPRGTQPIGEKYHDHCKCIAVPVPPGTTYTPPDYTDQWSQDYKKAWDAVPDGTPHKQVLPMVLAHMRKHTDAH